MLTAAATAALSEHACDAKGFDTKNVKLATYLKYDKAIRTGAAGDMHAESMERIAI
jgi:hypothetical protein